LDCTIAVDGTTTMRELTPGSTAKWHFGGYRVVGNIPRGIFEKGEGEGRDHGRVLVVFVRCNLESRDLIAKEETL
jgi:hypothetical protein